MPAIKRTTFTEFICRLHRFVYRASSGRVSGAIGGTQLLQPVHPGLTLGIEPALELFHDAIHRHLR